MFYISHIVIQYVVTNFIVQIILYIFQLHSLNYAFLYNSTWCILNILILQKFLDFNNFNPQQAFWSHFSLPIKLLWLGDVQVPLNQPKGFFFPPYRQFSPPENSVLCDLRKHSQDMNMTTDAPHNLDFSHCHCSMNDCN